MNFRILNGELIINCVINGGANPTMTITSSTVSSGDKTNDSTIALILISSESTDNFIVGDITVSNGSLSNFSGSGTTYNATFTPSGNATYTISVGANTFTDTSGNNNNVSNTFTWTYDSTAPILSSVSIASNNATNTLAKVNDVITATFTANETIQTPVVTFQSGSAAITDTSITYNNTSGNIWTAAYTADASDTDGAVTYSIAFTDSAGNAGVAVTSGSGSVTFDKTVPTLSSVSIASNNATNTLAKVDDVITATFTANETIQTPVVTFQSGSAAITDTSITYNNTSGNIWTAAYTANASDTDGAITYSIAFTDSVGNAGVAVTSGSGSVTFDKTVPVFSSVSPSTNSYVNTTAVGYTLSEAIASGTVIYTRTSGTVDNNSPHTVNLTGSELNTGIRSSAVLTNPPTLVNGTIYTIAFNSIDAAGNAATQVSVTGITFDTTVPTVSSFTMSDTALKVGDTSSVTLVFSEAVSGFSNADITVANGSLTTMSTTDNITWTGTFTPSTNLEDTENVLTLATSYTDIAGNAGPSSTTANYTIDTLAPTISSITPSWGAYLNAIEDNNAGTITVVTVNVEDSQTLTVGLNGSNYTNTVSSNSCTITISAAILQALTNSTSYTITGNVSDVAGNAATQVSTSFTVDTTSPTLSSVSIASNNATNTLAKVSDVITATFTANETIQTPVVTFQSGSSAITNTSITYNNTSGNTWTAAYTTHALDTSGAVTYSIAFTDSAGNAGVAVTSGSGSVTFDKTVPTVSSFTMSDTALKVGDTATVTLIFSEAAIAFSSADDITVQNGSLATMTSGNSITWTGTFTPSTNIEDTTNVLTLATTYTDLAGNAGPSATTANYTIDTTAPTISSITPSWGSVLSINDINSTGEIVIVTTNTEDAQTLTMVLNSVSYTGSISSNSITFTISSTILGGLTDNTTYSITANVSDAAGNAATQGVITFSIDRTSAVTNPTIIIHRLFST